MPLPRWLARANRSGLNRVAKHVAPWAPTLVLVCTPAGSPGAPYETPVMAFGDRQGFIVALTYGPGTDWVRNVVAAGGCQLRTGGRTLRMGSPRVYRDETGAGIRPVERQVLKWFGVADYLSLTTVD